MTIPQGETLRFKNDGPMRKKLFVAEAMSHPAKGHLGLWEAIISKYTQPGDTILDPMAGVGSSLLAALMGRNVICVEMESWMMPLLHANWEKMRQHPMLGCSLGQVVILQGDARVLPLPDRGGAEAIVTSPPFEDVTQGGDDIHKYAGGRPHSRATSYTRPDAIISSPPFGEAQSGGGLAITGTPHDPGVAQRIYSQQAMKASGGNVGNERGPQYWLSMSKIYAECHRVLKPGGIMALVLKGFTRDGQYVDLPQQTADLCESLGFKQFDTWRRELWALSFWRILQKRRDPAAFDDRLNFEEVLAFRKPEGMGQVDTVLTSPPYEGSLHGDEKKGKLFETEQRVNSPASGNRKSLRKPLGHGYTRPASAQKEKRR